MHLYFVGGAYQIKQVLDVCDVVPPTTAGAQVLGRALSPWSRHQTSANACVQQDWGRPFGFELLEFLNHHMYLSEIPPGMLWWDGPINKMH